MKEEGTTAVILLVLGSILCFIAIASCVSSDYVSEIDIFLAIVLPVVLLICTVIYLRWSSGSTSFLYKPRSRSTTHSDTDIQQVQKKQLEKELYSLYQSGIISYEELQIQLSAL